MAYSLIYNGMDGCKLDVEDKLLQAGHEQVAQHSTAFFTSKTQMHGSLHSLHVVAELPKTLRTFKMAGQKLRKEKVSKIQEGEPYTCSITLSLQGRWKGH